MPSFKTVSARAVVMLLIASFGGQDMAVQAQGACNADNCLRRLRNTAVVSRARVFCSAYTAGSFSNAPLPTYVAGCRVSAPAISSACSCIATTTTARPTTPTPTTIRTTTTPPATTSAPGACQPVTSYITDTNTATSTCPSASASSCPPPPSTTSCPPVSSPTCAPAAAVVTGPPGYELVPNSLFQFDPPIWTNIGEGFPDKLVSISADGSFSGLFGSRMLKIETSDSRPLAEVHVRVPVVESPHPEGRDWRVTAWFRTDANTADCQPFMGTVNLNTGSGNGFQPGSDISVRESKYVFIHCFSYCILSMSK
ncbi:hypothetical protein B0T11DRAFT_283676 [Plectosphaerella cucumerina]|uniref:Uncharacterized protein n=1 Tax=Plectosphaerella cucumerina TaxID=40658 RepID=A0A8K0TGL6_9PEZI|nr:hypothetical protein B0T11DRAFT_283676 [Plectosphaerella cucumerina]